MAAAVPRDGVPGGVEAEADPDREGDDEGGLGLHSR
jgi:hypothetical protein